MYDLVDNSVSSDRMSEADVLYFQKLKFRDTKYTYVKRVLDLALFFILLVPTLLVIIIVGVFIKLDSRGPIFFNHKRIGRDMQPFTAFKLRSMYVIRGPEVTLPDDRRITRVGKFIRRFRIDELPQIFNVFLGQMSFIGPRPLAPKEYMDSSYLFGVRTLVKPGITGLAQVNGGADIDNLTKLKYDAFYIENLSFHMDLKIFFKTFVVIFTGDGSR